MSDIREFTRRLTARLDELIAAQTQQLIKSGSANHDKIAGSIIGLNQARAEALREAGQWLTQNNLEAAQ